MIRQVDHIDEMEYLFHVARNDGHKNSNNYQDKRLHDYIAFHVYENDKDVIAFCGILPFHDGFCRVADRTYVMKDYRSRGLNSLGHGQFLSQHLLPVQTRYAIERGYCPFYSIQERKRRKSMQLSVEDFNKHNKYYSYDLLDGMYYTCSEYVEGKERCWQNVAVLGTDNGIRFRNSFKHRL